MQRKVYLVGELAEKFGSSFTVHASNYSDVFKCLEANHPNFKKYLLDAEERGIGFTIETAGKFEEEEKDLLLPLQHGDVTIAALPAGSKSGGAKIFAAIVLFVLAPGTGTAALIMKSLAVNLAMAGIQQIMAPDPSVDTESTNYLFNGSEQNIIEGDPVPILYGELRVPGRAVSLFMSTQMGYAGNNNYFQDFDNNLITFPPEFDNPPETYTTEL